MINRTYQRRRRVYPGEGLYIKIDGIKYDVKYYIRSSVISCNVVYIGGFGEEAHVYTNVFLIRKKILSAGRLK